MTRVAPIDHFWSPALKVYAAEHKLDETIERVFAMIKRSKQGKHLFSRQIYPEFLRYLSQSRPSDDLILDQSPNHSTTPANFHLNTSPAR